MKFKTTAIAMAVAGTVAAPVAVQAGADEIYASARIGIWNVDQGGTSDLEVRSYSSRFGAQGETDLGNGLTGFGRYEWDVDLNDESNTEALSVRQRYVGLKGDFGQVLIGQAYHTFYNFTVGPLDSPWWHSGYAMVSYVGRTDNAITYSGGAGAVAFGATAYFTNDDAGEDSPDGLELGASFGIGDMTLGVGYKSTADTTANVGAAAAANTQAGDIGNGSDEDIIGVTLSGIAIGDTSLAIGFQNQDKDDGISVEWLVGNAYVHVETESLDASDQDRTSITLGYTQSLGRKTSAWYEINTIDNDTGDSDDDRTAVMAVLKYDII